MYFAGVNGSNGPGSEEGEKLFTVQLFLEAFFNFLQNMTILC